ncbi:PAS domain S-box protein [Sorangium sp. So ce1078]|uniref:PAS domain S-box protein n=1 Tax=Sorangium sp. So ce1078 TaxID=3133329 RepID=UPI003F5E4578
MGPDPPDDPRVAELCELVLRLLPADRRGALPAALGADPLDQALSGLRALAKPLAAAHPAPGDLNERLEGLMDVIVALVGFDYVKKAPVSDRNDLIDGMAAGLNMLGEELASSTVSKTYVTSVIESMLDLLVVADRDSGIRSVNQAACDLSGYAREELVGRPLDLVFPGLSAGALIDEGGARDERVCLRKGGRTVAVSFLASVMRTDGGQIHGVVCVARDLTESKRAEEERWRLREAVHRQTILVEELSTPIIPITDGIVVVPLVGTLDEQRLSRMTESLLEALSARAASMVILDITGVRTVDQQAVHGLTRSVGAARLLGARVLLSGIRPDVARALVEIGADLDGVATFGSLQGGIVHALRGAAANGQRGPGARSG